MKKYSTVTLFLLILFVAYHLRFNNYATIPFPGDSLDEYSNSWVGLSLIELGQPVGISGLPAYQRHDFRYINIQNIFNTNVGDPFPIDQPWFDHPPLLGLLTGAFTYLKGGRVFEDTINVFIRKPMVYMGVLSVGLLFFLTYLLYGSFAALVTSAVYAVSPLIVVGSRMVQAENGYIPCLLASLICLELFLKKGKFTYFYLSALIAGVATLFKIPGLITVIIALVYLYLKLPALHPRRRLCVLFATTALSVTGLFLVYGLALNPSQFFAVFKSNTSRSYGIGPQALFELFTLTKITGTKYLTDAWPLLGWLSLFIILVKKNQSDTLLIISVLLYILMYIFLGSESYGWYRLPLYPFLFMAIGRLVQISRRDASATIPCLLGLLLPVGLGLSKVIPGTDFRSYVSYWRYGFIFFIIISLAANHRYRLYIIYILFFAALFISLLYNRSLTLSAWYYSS